MIVIIIKWSELYRLAISIIVINVILSTRQRAADNNNQQ